MTQPETAGPNRDGSQSLARESRFGLIIQFVLTVLATAVLGYATNLDLSTLPGWAAGAGVCASAPKEAHKVATASAACAVRRSLNDMMCSVLIRVVKIGLSPWP